MMYRTQLQRNIGVKDICLVRYSMGAEKKSLLATLVEIDEFSEYHPMKLVCKMDAEELSILPKGIPVSIVIKKSGLLLYVLLKGNVFHKSTLDGYLTLSIGDVQFFAKEEKNNISSFKKINNILLLPAA